MAHVNREVYLMCKYCIEHVDRPDEYVAYSEPADCLCGKSDEDNLGFTYAALDHYIRTGECDDPCVKAVIDDKHTKNLFKMKPIPHFEYKVNN